MIYSLGDRRPAVAPGCFVAPSAELIGDVTLGAKSSVWFHAVLRGDVEAIVVGCETNIQDGSIIHGTLGRARTVIGDRVTVGHMCMLHGCHIGSGSLIGMGSIVMDLVEVGEHCLVGAGSLLTEESVYEPESLILGRPAKVVRKLRADEVRRLEKSADHYLEYMSWYKNMVQL